MIGRQGVLYLEDCYQTDGDKLKAEHFRTFLVSNRILPPMFAASAAERAFYHGDHWDLFDGRFIVAEAAPIANNTHPGKLYFWLAGS